MKKTIKLTIQEIVIDFESMIKSKEHITTLDEIDRLDDENCLEFHEEMENMAIKYMPEYERHLPARYFSDTTSDRQKGEILSDILEENFREIFYQLV